MNHYSHLAWGGVAIRFCFKGVLIILLLYKSFCFSIEYTLLSQFHSMLILLDYFLSFITVSLVLLNLFLESSKHSFLRLWRFLFICLNVCVVFRLIFIWRILEFVSKFANETAELFVTICAFIIALRSAIGWLLFDNYLLNYLRLFLVWELSIVGCDWYLL